MHNQWFKKIDSKYKKNKIFLFPGNSLRQCSLNLNATCIGWETTEHVRLKSQNYHLCNKLLFKGTTYVDISILKNLFKDSLLITAT